MDNISRKLKLWNGVEMPCMGLGVYKVDSGAQTIETIHHALDSGYRHLDTASYYGNESSVGEAIKSGGVRREELFVTTKVWNEDHGFDATLQAFERSLEKLQLQYLDLYLVHWPVPGLYLETWNALEKLYRENKVRAIGVSNFLEHQLGRILTEGQIKPMVVQNEFHPKLVQQDLLDFCTANQMQYVGWSPLMRGRILDNPLLVDIGKRYGKTAAQVVLRWDLQKGVVPIPKSVHKARIAENAAIFDFSLNPEEIALIDSLDVGERTGAHPDDFMDHFR